MVVRKPLGTWVDTSTKFMRRIVADHDSLHCESPELCFPFPLLLTASYNYLPKSGYACKRTAKTTSQDMSLPVYNGDNSTRHCPAFCFCVLVFFLVAPSGGGPRLGCSNGLFFPLVPSAGPVCPKVSCSAGTTGSIEHSSAMLASSGSTDSALSGMTTLGSENTAR